MIHFVPTGPITPAMTKAIRSHATKESRRIKRQQRQLALWSKPLTTKSSFLEDNVCRCLFAQAPPLLGSSETAKPKSHSAIKKQQVADRYKICFGCHRIQFIALSQPGQLMVANTYPEITALLQLKLDPFNSLPGLPSSLSLVDSRAFNEITTHRKRSLFCSSSLWQSIFGPVVISSKLSFHL